MCLKLEHKRRHFETNKVSWPHEQNHPEKTISFKKFIFEWLLINRTDLHEMKRKESIFGTEKGGRPGCWARLKNGKRP